MKKTLAILSILTVISAAAQTPPQPSSKEVQPEQSYVTQTFSTAIANVGGEIANSFIGLEKYIGDIYNTGISWVITENYQKIPNLTSTTNANTTTVTPPPKTTNTIAPVTASQKVAPMQAAELTAQKETADNLQNNLTQFYYAFEKIQHPASKLTSIKTAEGEPFSTYEQNGNIAMLTTQPTITTSTNATPTPNPITQASDTLFIKDPTGDVSADDQPYIKAPTKVDNGFLDFASFITPTAYTQAQQENAANYLKFAAQSTQNLASPLNFSKSLTTNGLKYLKQFGVGYQKYMFTVRSLSAIKSISINTLNLLKAERTPIPGLGAAAGITTERKAKLTPLELQELKNNEASPLQVEAYQANRRFDSQSWYQSVENASPATVQRETLIVLAEIEHQNYEAHLDRERLLAATTAQNLLSSLQVANTTLSTEATDANKDLATAGTK